MKAFSITCVGADRDSVLFDLASFATIIETVWWFSFPSSVITSCVGAYMSRIFCSSIRILSSPSKIFPVLSRRISSDPTGYTYCVTDSSAFIETKYKSVNNSFIVASADAELRTLSSRHIFFGSSVSVLDLGNDRARPCWDLEQNSAHDSYMQTSIFRHTDLHDLVSCQKFPVLLRHNHRLHVPESEKVVVTIQQLDAVFSWLQ